MKKIGFKLTGMYAWGVNEYSLFVDGVFVKSWTFSQMDSEDDAQWTLDDIEHTIKAIEPAWKFEKRQVFACK